MRYIEKICVVQLYKERARFSAFSEYAKTVRPAQHINLLYLQFTGK
jgi:hypothetical protein